MGGRSSSDGESGTGALSRWCALLHVEAQGVQSARLASRSANEEHMQGHFIKSADSIVHCC